MAWSQVPALLFCCENAEFMGMCRNVATIGHREPLADRCGVPGRLRSSAVVIVILAVHGGLLAYSATRYSPTWDEIGHLPAGIAIWQWGRHDLYRVNPPLVRAIAAIPVIVARPQLDWSPWRADSADRSEWELGRRLIEANGWRSARLFFVFARWACIPFSLVGAYVCFRWARELYGSGAGLLALTLWCFSPTVLAYGQLITPDAAASALGAVAVYAFWRWLKRPDWWRAVVAGAMLGLAELTKSTWIALFILSPALWVAARGSQPKAGKPGNRLGAWAREAPQLGLILALGLYVLNLGYGFEGSFKRLGDYRFVSRTLGGDEERTGEGGLGRNRFAHTWLADAPVPLPNNYLLGIDVAKHDFEQRLWSYLHGEWRLGGWWYWYLYALLIKEPLGTWLLAALAVAATLFARGYAAPWRDELVLLTPFVAVLGLVSSQTGYNHHVRYVLPILPFAFIWISKVACAVEFRHWKVATIAAIALAWSVGSSLWVYPHSLSYFNELAPGPTGGHYHLGNSNMDWGQDLIYLSEWLDDHPEPRMLRLAYDMPLVDPKLAHVEYVGPPPGTPEPGWHAVSVNQIHNRSRSYEYFLRFRPVAMAGYSIYIYHVTLEEANRVRRELGLSELSGETDLGS